MFSSSTSHAILVLAMNDEKATETEKSALKRVLTGDVRASSRVVKYKEAARRLGLSYQTIKNLVGSGALKGVRGSAGRMVGVSEESILDYCS